MLHSPAFNLLLVPHLRNKTPTILLSAADESIMGQPSKNKESPFEQTKEAPLFRKNILKNSSDLETNSGTNLEVLVSVTEIRNIVQAPISPCINGDGSEL